MDKPIADIKPLSEAEKAALDEWWAKIQPLLWPRLAAALKPIRPKPDPSWWPRDMR